jgi:hypothetical protein
VATIAYVDHEVLRRWYAENPPPVRIDRTVKFAIGGKFINGEFRTVVDNTPITAILQGYMDKSSQEVVKSRVVKSRRLEPALAGALAGGQMLVYN